MTRRCPYCGHDHDKWMLDLFCGAGGAGMGYHRAGFGMVGVDNRPQPHYPFTFHQADAMDVLAAMAEGDPFYPSWMPPVAAIHASPPCQRYSAATPAGRRSRWPDSIAPVRHRLRVIGRPWVIENVPGAPVRPDLKLCGCMFRLPNLKRERWFETSWRAFDLRQSCDHKPGDVLSVTGTGYGGKHRGHNGTKPDGIEHARKIMGIDWMTIGELSAAIPPAYTEHLGAMLLDHLKECAS